MYESTGTRIRREEFHELSTPRIFTCDQRRMAVYAHDFRRSLKSAEHDDNSAILAGMSGRLSTTTREILVNHFKGTKHPERVAPLGRHIDVTV